MPLELITKEEDLSKLPEINVQASSTLVTIGDLHGNMMKLLHFLIANHVIVADSTPYNELFTLYQKDKITVEEFKRIKTLIYALPFYPSDELPFIRLIGDELTDRGENDLYVLWLLDAMEKNGVTFDIMQSNHTREFTQLAIKRSFANTERLRQFLDFTRPVPDVLLGGKPYMHSTFTLIESLERNWIQAEECQRLAAMHRKHLKLMEYSLSDNTITIFTHAPINFSLIKAVSMQLGVEYHDDTTEQLAESIDKINQYYQNALIKANEAAENFRKHSSQSREFTEQFLPSKALTARKEADKYFNEFKSYNPIIQMKDELEILIWQRQEDMPSTPEELSPNGTYHVKFVHGHDSCSWDKEHIFCIDDDFAKGKEDSDIKCEHRWLTCTDEELSPLIIAAREEAIKERAKPDSSASC